jgi:hypothetical protein
MTTRRSTTSKPAAKKPPAAKPTPPADTTPAAPETSEPTPPDPTTSGSSSEGVQKAEDGRPKCYVEDCELPEVNDGVRLCGKHYATRPDLWKEARRNG